MVALGGKRVSVVQLSTAFEVSEQGGLQGEPCRPRWDPPAAPSHDTGAVSAGREGPGCRAGRAWGWGSL